MNPSNIYPRTGDTQTVYLNQVVTDPSILVGTTPCITTLSMTPLTLKRTMCCITILSNHDRLVIGKFCSIACGAKFLFNSANTACNPSLPIPFPSSFEEWGLDRSQVARAWDNKVTLSSEMMCGSATRRSS